MTNIKESLTSTPDVRDLLVQQMGHQDGINYLPMLSRSQVAIRVGHIVSAQTYASYVTAYKKSRSGINTGTFR